MRNRAHAFEQMRARLDLLRAAGVPFGFIFTLTMDNLPELDWVAGFATAEGARLLQIHPLEQVGRAREYELRPPDDLELSYGFLEVARLQREYQGRLTLQYDVADRQLIAREPCRAFAGPAVSAEVAADARLAALVSPLVVQEDGWVVPIQHGFATAHAIARLDRGPFRAQAAHWKRERYPRFRHLAARVWEDMRDAPEHLPFTNWYAAITTASARQRSTRPLPTPVQVTA
jgi:hypothetical protein